jgi:hypothetical protein
MTSLPSCIETGGYWDVENNIENNSPLKWKWNSSTGSCNMYLDSPQQIRESLANRTVYFVGDSTMREMLWDTALYLKGCPHRPLSGARRLEDSFECNLIISKSWGHWFATIRNQDGSFLNLGFHSLTYARLATSSDWWKYLLLNATDNDGTKYDRSLTILMNAGHWNLRFDAKELNLLSYEEVKQNYVKEVSTMIQNLTAHPNINELRQRLIWRSTLPIDAGASLGEMFTLARIEECNNIITKMWKDAGFRVLDVWKFGNVADPSLSSLLRRDGIHYRPWANAAMLNVVASVVLDSINKPRQSVREGLSPMKRRVKPFPGFLVPSMNESWFLVLILLLFALAYFRRKKNESK